MRLFAVVDTKGAGRLVGIFDDPDRAERIRDIDRGYFRLLRADLNAVNPVAIDWLLSESQRELLKQA